MPVKTFQVEVQPDFLKRQANAAPVQALAELIWNAVDADATRVSIDLDYNDLGMSGIRIRDDGHGIPYGEVESVFKPFGASWKKPDSLTKTKARRLHGFEGRGRFKAFALGRVADWHVTYATDDGEYFTYDIGILEDNLQEVRISEQQPIKTKQTGVEVAISELHRDFRSLDADSATQDLAEIFALYLQNYKDVSIVLQSIKVDPTSAIASSKRVSLEDIQDEGASYTAELEIIEWKTSTRRALYLCTDQGFPLSQVSTRFHVGDFQFSAYLKSQFVNQLHENNVLELAEMNSVLEQTIDEAFDAIKDYARDRAAQTARTVVDEWKADEIYPFQGEPKTPVEEAERTVFDIVALNVNKHLPDFAESTRKNKALHLRMLRQAIEKSPEELQIILNEVLGLPQRKQQELAKLLEETSLSAIISASKLIADRLRFAAGLETLLFDAELKKHLKERSQLHRLLAQNTWIFGEEFNLSADDESLTKVLRKHLTLLKTKVAIDTTAPVKTTEGTTGIIDLMLSRVVKMQRSDELEHLVVELKAPKVKVGSDATTQIKKYAFAVAEDERFRSLNVRWHFWVISTDMDKHTRREVEAANQPNGMLYQSENREITIWVKTWSEIIHENNQRLKFFQEKLELQVDQRKALKYLRDSYGDLLDDVVTDGAIEQIVEQAAS